MSRQLESGRVIAARYELARPLAAGHDATTWLARELASGRDVVLRFHETPDDRSRQLLEVVANSALLAPIERARDAAGAIDVFEYLPGGEIGRLRGRPWPLIARRLIPIVDALAAIHDAGWVHGDLKTANVLLDADGLARLGDFGSAVPVGTSRQGAGSPYSISPERMDGAPAATADDIYAFGVLIHELVSGHPPFYPDLSAERVRSEVPAPLEGRPVPPDSLRSLVARCLAKDRAARPESMRRIQQELEQCLADAEAGVTPPVTPAWTPRPPAEAIPIRPDWRRSETAGPTARELRREGFRRGLLAGATLLALVAIVFTFFVLPELVASRDANGVQTEVAQPESAPVQAAAPPPDLERLAELKRRADERRAPLPARLQQIEQKDATNWGRDALVAARNALVAGDKAMDDREFEAAIAQFDAAAAALDTLERRAPEVVRELLAVAKSAFDAGKSSDAQAQYAAALRVDPANATARTGLARSKVLDDVLRATSLGARAEQSGSIAEATAAYQRALKLDPAAPAAREGLARLQSRVAGDAYSAAVARALAALAGKDFAGAQRAFEQAAQIRPGTPEVAEGLQQVRRATETRVLASTVDRAMAAEAAERWSEALASYREALKAEPTLQSAQQGVERAEPRAMLDAELQAYIDRPERLYSGAGRDAARSVLSRAAGIATAGARLQGQRIRLQELLRQAETPIRVALSSDNATDVQIYRIGKLGLFEHKDLELMPGRYTVVGTRQGYRDVRKEFHLVPGTPPPPAVEVRCEERI